MSFFLLFSASGLGATYSHTPTAFGWIDPSAHATVAWSSPTICTGFGDTIGDDALTNAIAIGFTFPFGASSYNQLYIMTNGRLQFGNTSCFPGTLVTGPPRTYTHPYPDPNLTGTMRVYGADLDASPNGSGGGPGPTTCTGPGCGVFYTATPLGTAPNRQFVVTWVNTPDWGSTGSFFNVQIILNEDGTFVYQYGASNNLNSGHADIGWELGMSDYDALSYSNVGSLASTAMLFFDPLVPTRTPTPTPTLSTDLHADTDSTPPRPRRHRPSPRRPPHPNSVADEHSVPPTPTFTPHIRPTHRLLPRLTRRRHSDQHPDAHSDPTATPVPPTPTFTPTPTDTPTATPTHTPTPTPTDTPTHTPTDTPTATPTETPHSDQHPDTDRHADRYADAHADSDADPNGDADPYADGDRVRRRRLRRPRHAVGDTDTSPTTDRHRYAVGDRDADRDSDPDTDADRVAFALSIDPPRGAGSDGNGIFEPGETSSVAPTWKNDGTVSVLLTGYGLGVHRPGGGAYTVVDGDADYGLVGVGATSSCVGTANCYSLFAASFGPAAGHALGHDVPGDPEHRALKTWLLHLGDSFTDVPRGYPFYRKIETVLHNGITVGCTPSTYCPTDKVPRSQMAIFLARGLTGGGASDERHGGRPAVQLRRRRRLALHRRRPHGHLLQGGPLHPGAERHVGLRGRSVLPGRQRVAGRHGDLRREGDGGSRRRLRRSHDLWTGPRHRSLVLLQCGEPRSAFHGHHRLGQLLPACRTTSGPALSSPAARPPSTARISSSPATRWRSSSRTRSSCSSTAPRRPAGAAAARTY